jgi:lysyl-tRNA synthetase, class I
MFWADELAEGAIGPQVINDSKTPSGTIHVGALRGVVMHDVIARAVRNHGAEVRFLYGIDDLDPMDSATLATREGVSEYMGRPLAEVPAPRGSAEPTWARHFVQTFLDTFDRLGIHPELYWASEQYRAGVYDAFISEALDKQAEVLRVYREVSNVRHADDWHPLMVICERCGRIGTTYVDGWDGREVTYRCLPDLVDWAVGCGHRGRVSPFGGRAKLPWNLHWVAKWKHFGVTIEGAGKDLSTKGGSRDRAEALAREVFGFEPPRNVPYEFLLIGGRKMKSSAGTGAAADVVVELLPPELVRFLMLRPRPKVAIEFDPEGTDAIPRLFDEFDRIAAATAGHEVRGELPPDHDRIFALSSVQADADQAALMAEGAAYRPPFAHLALLEQIPGVDVVERVSAEKGEPLTELEAALLEDRRRAVRAWLTTYAPERSRLRIHRDRLPEVAADLDPQQRGYLPELAAALAGLAEPAWVGETLQAEIFDAARRRKLPAGRAFGAIYLAFLGQPSGPRAGWLLAALEREFVIDRLREAGSLDTLTA